MKTKGIGPNNLGAPKGIGKIMISPAKKDPPSKKEMDYIVAENANKDIKRAEREDKEDSYAASREVPGSFPGSRWNDAKKRAGQRRTNSYGFPKSVSDK